MADIPQVRFRGALWAVAMCDKDWAVFCGVSTRAHLRLQAIIEQLCEHGEPNLPPGWLSWVAPDDGDHPDAEMGAIEACGVVLHGRRARNGLANTFFVTRIVVDPQPTDASPRSRRSADIRQRVLPLGFNDSTKRR